MRTNWLPSAVDGPRAQAAKDAFIRSDQADYFLIRKHHQIIECTMRGLSFNEAMALTLEERFAYLQAHPIRKP